MFLKLRNADNKIIFIYYGHSLNGFTRFGINNNMGMASIGSSSILFSLKNKTVECTYFMAKHM